MKLADRTVETHSAGVQNSNQFSIAQTSKMFKILSDSLYSDKIMAVIRELSTNAHDSHVASGNKNPFKVTLPNTSNPIFAVRDFGTGLSQTDMEELYTTYGASNKNTSNDFVGCLGLGSKSPFAYTKSFTTSSYFNGKKYTYVAAIDDSGVPTLNLLTSSDTDEPNGLEIRFAVKSCDFSEFSSKAVRVFHYFKTKPIVEGGYSVNFESAYSNTNIVINGNDWRVCRFNNDTSVFPNHYHHVNSGIIAVMGNIAYPVNIEHIIGQDKAEASDNIQKWNRAFAKADIDNWKNFVKEVLNTGLYLELDFSIGELEMDVSREGLQYTKAVIKTLREKTQEIYLEMKEQFSRKITESKTLVEAISLYYQLNDLAGGWGVGASWTDSSGTKHNISSGEDLTYKIPTGKSLFAINYRTAAYKSRRMVYNTQCIHHETLNGRGQYYWNNKTKNGPLTFFFCDIKNSETAKKIAVKYCNDNDCFGYLLVDAQDHTKCRDGWNKIIEDVGLDNIKNISDYKNIIQSKKSNTPRKSNGSVSNQDVFFICNESETATPIEQDYNDSRYLSILSEDDLEDFMDSEEVVYVPILRYCSEQNYPSLGSISSLYANHIDIYKKIFGDQPIYAIKSSSVQKLKDSGVNLVDFNQCFYEGLKKVAKSVSAAGKLSKIIDHCTKHMMTKSGWGQSVYTEQQFTAHMINIFGLDYGNYIKNTKLVDIIDNVILMDFFAYRLTDTDNNLYFKKNDYDSHIQKLLNDIGLNDYTPDQIRKSVLEMNIIKRIIKNNMYEVNSEYYVAVLESDPYDCNMVPAEALRKIVKAELDKNPMIRYIMASRETVGLSSLSNSSGSNPIKWFRPNYYGDSEFRDWVYKMSDDSALLFKTQMASLIG